VQCFRNGKCSILLSTRHLLGYGVIRTGNARVVSLLWCEVCRSYERKICCQKNFSKMWINGSGNHRTSNVIDHATSSQHKAAMKFDQAKKSQQLLAAAAPIVGSLMKLDALSHERLCRKFDISFVMAKEGTKYAPLYELEVRHEVDLGILYNNDVSAKCFARYIAESQWKTHKKFVEESVCLFFYFFDGRNHRCEDGGRSCSDDVLRERQFFEGNKIMHEVPVSF